MLRICDLSKPPEHTVTDYATKYSFPLDIFQEHAIAAIDQGHNVLVCAKTGSGKTLVAEYTIAHCLRQGTRVFYTTPIKSLSNQKFHDLRQLYPGLGMVGIMTGDIKFCPDAPIVIMTTEILRNLLYKQGSATEHIGLTANLSLANLGAVVFDECHYINDRDRGKVWEETMVLLPKEVQLVMLSATLDKPDYFAEWLGELKQTPCHLIQTQYRIVPLTHYVLRGSNLHPIMDNKEVFYDQTYSDWLRSRTQAVKDHEDYQKKVAAAKRSGHEGPVSGKTRPVSFHHQLNECVSMLHEKQLLPALAFVFSRKGCEQLAAKTSPDFLDSSDAALTLTIFDFHLRKHREQLETLPQYHTIRTLIPKGIAFHHSGLLPVLKEVIEILFTKGLIKLLYCTETFAVGINMPTKTVIFTGFSKFDDATGGMRLLRTDEYIQMAGRAGRRGKDPVGTVILLPEREPPTTAEMKLILKGGRPQIQSRMDFHYDFLLKTLQNQNLRWMELQDKTYWKKQQLAAIQGDEKELARLEADISKIALTEEQVVDLEEKQRLEDLVKTTTNAKRRDAQRQLDRWKDSHLGPKWALAQDHYQARAKLLREMESVKTSLEGLKTFHGNAEEWLQVLKALDFLDESNGLTTKGLLATECNECHCLLVPEFYIRGLWKTLTPEELLTTLACCIEEKQDADAPTLSELNVPKAVKEAMQNLESIQHYAQLAENKVGVHSPESFWTLSTTWVEPVWRWLQGDHVSAICQELGLFEGNFVRTILRVSSMAEEINSMATYMEHVDLLESLRNIQTKLVRDVMTPDSLYLHL
jgi:superfamily II RNA helicase